MYELEVVFFVDAFDRADAAKRLMVALAEAGYPFALIGRRADEGADPGGNGRRVPDVRG